VVRLSFVEGQVAIQRPDVGDWAEAPVNTPLEEGFSLSTGESSFAEVEFENGSTVRLGELSVLEFTSLGLAPDGSKINRLALHQGYATFSAAPEAQGIYEVSTSYATLTPTGHATFRVDLDSSQGRVEVFRGSLEVSGSMGTWTLAKNSVLDLMPGAEQPALLSEGITLDEWDRWVQQRQSELDSAAKGPPAESTVYSGPDTSYGWSDLSSAGNWGYVPSFGYGWIPSVGTGWNPYSLGRWCWYPGFGYTWISAEPWGWLPYHFGGWNYIPGIGWMWFPGSFGPWSPGLVTWYGGPGWIGWMPRSGRPSRGGPNPCPQGQPCGIAMRASDFQKGRSVRPATILPVDLVASGRVLEQPNLPPARQAYFAGRIVNRVTDQSGIQIVSTGSRSSSTGAQPVPGTATGYPTRHAAPGPTMTYDSQAGRYVNASPATSLAKPAPPSAPSGGSAGTGQVQGGSWSHQSAPRADSSSTAPRSTGSTSAGASASSTGGSASGTARGGGGGGGGNHAGGGGGSSGGPHR
jgi:uncharacterized membrane protein YgcG